MQGKKPGGGGGGERQAEEAPPGAKKRRKKGSSCFSSIQVFLVSECALMLAQGTVGAYLDLRFHQVLQCQEHGRTTRKICNSSRTLATKAFDNILPVPRSDAPLFAPVPPRKAKDVRRCTFCWR
ncbi:UNVERIFIED_CONTAM: hypothetical protein K2H54_025395 [Gekko kuhli]